MQNTKIIERLKLWPGIRPVEFISSERYREMEESKQVERSTKIVQEIRDISRTFANLGKKVVVATKSHDFYQLLEKHKVDHLVDIIFYSCDVSLSKYDVVINIDIIQDLSFGVSDNKNSLYMVKLF